MNQIDTDHLPSDMSDEIFRSLVQGVQQCTSFLQLNWFVVLNSAGIQSGMQHSPIHFEARILERYHENRWASPRELTHHPRNRPVRINRRPIL